MADLVGLRALVSNRLDQALVAGAIPASGVFWTLSEVTAWINEGYNELYSEIAQTEVQTLITETSGTYTGGLRRMNLRTILGAITDDPLRIEEVRDVTGVAASGTGRVITHQNRRSFQGGVTSTSQPYPLSYERHWDWAGANPMYLYLFPVPTNSLTLRISWVPAAPAALLQTTDVPSMIPTLHHNLLVLYAVVKAKQKEEDSSWKDDEFAYQQGLERFRQSIEERNAQSSRPVFAANPSEYGGY